MLSVTNTFGLRQIITQKDVSKVAKGALESVLLDTEDHSLDIGVREQINDSVFFGGRKQTTLSQIHGLSRHAAALSLEFEKPIEKRNQLLIKVHVDAIYDSQQKLSELHPGRSLEVGTERGLPVIGKESYLILRSKDKINPLGIALYAPSEKPAEIPSFKSVNEIEVDHIQAIRINGRLRCEGRKYKVYFDEINRPIVIREVLDADWLLIQTKLSCLYSKHKAEFRLNSPEVVDVTNSVLLSTTSTTDVELIHPASETGGAMQAEADLEGIPAFEGFDDILDRDLLRIRISEKLKCREKIFTVKFGKDNEPVLLADSDDIDGQLIQTRLAEVWIKQRAKVAILTVSSIRKADATLPLTSEMEGAQTVVMGVSGTDIQRSAWYLVRNKVETRFAIMVSLYEKTLDVEKEELIQLFESLIVEVAVTEIQKLEQSEALKKALDRVGRIATRQDNVKVNVENFKKIYVHLLSLLRTSSGSEQMERIIKKRIKNVSRYFGEFVVSRMEERDLLKFNTMLSNQFEFVKNFNAEQVLRCIALRRTDNPVLDGVTMSSAPKGSNQAKLDELLKEPTTPWSEITMVMGLLQLENDDSAMKALQVKTGLELDNELQFVQVSFAIGAEPASGKSIYTPETYSRIVSCKNICAQLRNKNVCLTRQKVDAMKAEFKEHRLYILKETEELNQSAKGPLSYFRRQVLYKPMKNSTGSLMNYAQFSAHQKDVQRRIQQQR